MNEGADMAFALFEADAVAAGGDDDFRPVVDLGLIGRWDAEEFHDDGHGEGEGVVGDEVEVALVGDFIQEVIGDCLDARPDKFNAARGECLADEGA